jgi:hypothetical protein
MRHAVSPSRAQLALDFSAPRPAIEETLDDALAHTFPVEPLTEQQLYEYFLWLFPD